jgi:hypothetical protein
MNKVGKVNECDVIAVSYGVFGIRFLLVAIEICERVLQLMFPLR